MHLRQTLFHPHGNEKHETKLNKDTIVTKLLNVVSNYNHECFLSAPSKSAIKRKIDFLMRIEKLQNSASTTEITLAFIAIFNFYMQHRNSGRLLNHIENALISIFNVKIPAEKICHNHDYTMDRIDNHYAGFAKLRAEGEAAFFHEIEYKAVKQKSLEEFIKQAKHDSAILKVAHQELSERLVEHLPDIVCDYLTPAFISSPRSVGKS